MYTKRDQRDLCIRKETNQKDDNSIQRGVGKHLRAQVRHICQKRPMYTKRAPQKRPVHMQRDMSKEIYIHEKKPLYTKRDLQKR